MRNKLSLLFVNFVLFTIFFVFPIFCQTLDDMLGNKEPENSTVVTTPDSKTPVPVVPPSVPDSANVDEMRKKIISLAQDEVGKVEHSPGPDGFKIGWPRLKLYYEIAYKLTDLEKERPHWLKQLKAPFKRIEKGPAHWCGIFCVWAWRTSGLPVYWDTRTIGCKYRGDKANIQPGDICIIKKAVNPNNHHCLVKSRDGNSLTTIDGNQNLQSIGEKKRSLSDVEIFYSVADAMGAGKNIPNGKTPSGEKKDNPGGSKKGGTTTPGGAKTAGGSTVGGGNEKVETNAIVKIFLDFLKGWGLIP